MIKSSSVLGGFSVVSAPVKHTFFSGGSFTSASPPELEKNTSQKLQIARGSEMSCTWPHQVCQLVTNVTQLELGGENSCGLDAEFSSSAELMEAAQETW